MRSLTSLAIIRRRSETEQLADGWILLQLLSWLFCPLENGIKPWPPLERLWIEENRFPQPPADIVSRKISGWKSMKSFLLTEGSVFVPQFKGLLHLGDIEDGILFQKLDYLPNLKYIRGTARDAKVVGYNISQFQFIVTLILCTTQGFNDFCQSHPLLEELHVKVWPKSAGDSLSQEIFKGKWKLLSLKVLVVQVVDDCKLPFGIVYITCHILYSIIIGLIQLLISQKP